MWWDKTTLAVFAWPGSPLSTGIFCLWPYYVTSVTGLLVLFHDVLRRGASWPFFVVVAVLNLSGLSHWCDLPVWSCAPPPQTCLRVVSWWSVDIHLVVWKLCFGKVGGVISFLVGPVRGIVRQGHSGPIHLISASSIYAAKVYVPGV
jgi:hypothetical protein